MPEFDLTVPIARDPAGVARWWLDFPADYRATDPREQPFRIETLSRTAERIDVRTTWRMMGRTRVFDETIWVRGPLAFDAQITMGRVVVEDTFRLAEDGRGGSLMRIHTTMRPRGPMGKVAANMMAPLMHRWMRKVWADAATLCAEEGRRQTANTARTPQRPLGAVPEA